MMNVYISGKPLFTRGRTVLGILLGGVLVTGWIAWYLKRRRKQEPVKRVFPIDDLDSFKLSSSTPVPNRFRRVSRSSHQSDEICMLYFCIKY